MNQIASEGHSKRANSRATTGTGRRSKSICSFRLRCRELLGTSSSCATGTVFDRRVLRVNASVARVVALESMARLTVGVEICTCRGGRTSFTVGRQPPETQSPAF